MVTEAVKQNREYVIYGAQIVAVGAREAIRHLTGIEPLCFAVGKSKGKPNYPLGNPDEIEGVSVRPIEEVPKDMLIVVGVTELIQKEVLPFLEENGYRNVYPLTYHEEYLLMSEYYKSINRFPIAEVAEAKTTENVDLCVYEVRNDRDKPLGYHPDLFSYETPIQAGAALAERSIAEIKDNTGSNISNKNRMYCEMSAVYWVWKNSTHAWVGIEHYRRHLLVDPKMLSEDVDVILPLPYICFPHELSQFSRFVSRGVVEVLLKSLKDLHPDKFKDYEKILYDKYQYAYNFVCARKEVFDKYCRWAFEVTEHMEKYYASEVPDLIETRALAYTSEVLTNLYFMYHQKELKIRHVEKTIYT